MTKLTKLWFILFAALCAAALTLSLYGMFFFASPTQQTPAAYRVCDVGGRVGVYAAGAAEPEIYDIYVNLLPEPDVLRLKDGIELADSTALARLLEDLGS